MILRYSRSYSVRLISFSLNRVLNYAVRVGYIKDNPIRYVIVKGEGRLREKTIITERDFERLLNALEERNDFRYDAYIIAIKIGYYTGSRISEALALEKMILIFSPMK